jgi:hypothetical protein
VAGRLPEVDFAIAVGEEGGAPAVAPLRDVVGESHGDNSNTPWHLLEIVPFPGKSSQRKHEIRDCPSGKLPASDTELNGDYLQTLVRLANMIGDRRFIEWARRIGDAYIDEVLPANHDVPSSKWDFTSHTGDGRLRLRDHGNETVVGLVLLYTYENYHQTPRAARYRPVIAKMLDRILESANPDGLLYNEVDSATLKPVDQRLSDNWGYVYGAVYTFYQCTGETKYRDAVRRVLRNLPKYRNYVWEPRKGTELGSFDGYADSIESAIYLVNREPVPGAFDWIDSEMKVMRAAAAGRVYRRLVRGREFQPHRAAGRADEEPGRQAGNVEAGRACGGRAGGRPPVPEPCRSAGYEGAVRFRPLPARDELRPELHSPE